MSRYIGKAKTLLTGLYQCRSKSETTIQAIYGRSVFIFKLSSGIKLKKKQ